MGNSASAREAFDKMDTDKSGELDFEEIDDFRARRVLSGKNRKASDLTVDERLPRRDPLANRHQLIFSHQPGHRDRTHRASAESSDL